MLLHPSPTEPERGLYEAWEALNKLMQTPRITLRVQHRITSCVGDVLCFSEVCAAFQEPVAADFETMSTAPLGLAPLMEARQKAFAEARAAGGSPKAGFEALEAFDRENAAELEVLKKANGDLLARVQRGQRFASGIKAFFFFARALQDAAYCALLEADGQKSGRHSSMGDGVKHPILGAVLREQIEGYSEWFQTFREIRNRMKYGVNTGSGFIWPGPRLVRVTVHEVQENPPRSNIYRELTTEDLNEALRQSTRLLALLTRRIQGGP